MKLTNKHNLSASVVRCIEKDTYQGPKGELNRVSATSIIDSPRIHFLKCRHWADLSQDVSGMLWALLGTSVHAMLERAEDDTTIKEERIDQDLNGITISGQMDVLAEHRIEDWKTTSVYKVIYNPTGDPGWIKQLNIYRWLASKKGFDVKELVVNAILRDHQGSKAKIDPAYPQTPFVTINLPVWPIEEIDSYLNGRVALFKSCAELADDKLPVCTFDEMWSKPDSYAVMKDGRKSAVAVCETEDEAKAKCAPGCTIVKRPGTRNRCEEYCLVKEFCNTYKATKEATE